MITLVLGGARSGKSAVAERLASQTNEPVTYIATAYVGDDQDMKARVEAHRRRRPPHWTTVECGNDLVVVLSQINGTALIDSLGPWLAALPAMSVDTQSLCDALRARSDYTIIVSDEVGLSVHPESVAGREFRDKLGELNQVVALVATTVLFVVAGQTMTLKSKDGS
jgi:adenosylcobinamide kinase/adenosylcobinamide-phosphate guanylyltransferase